MRSRIFSLFSLVAALSCAAALPATAEPVAKVTARSNDTVLTHVAPAHVFTITDLRGVDTLGICRAVQLPEVRSIEASTATSLSSVAVRSAEPPSGGLGLGSPVSLIPFAAPFLIGMTALAKERDTLTRGSHRKSYDIAANVKIFQGSIVMLDTGVAKPGATAVGKLAIGRACQTYDNTGGGAAAMPVEVETGEFQYANSAAGDLIAAADIGNDCYIVDDQTVAKTNGGSTRSRAGRITGVDSRGVWVSIGIGL